MGFILCLYFLSFTLKCCIILSNLTLILWLDTLVWSSCLEKMHKLNSFIYALILSSYIFNGTTLLQCFIRLILLILKYFVIIKKKKIVVLRIDFDDYKIFESINDFYLWRNLSVYFRRFKNFRSDKDTWRRPKLQIHQVRDKNDVVWKPQIHSRWLRIIWR